MSLKRKKIYTRIIIVLLLVFMPLSIIYYQAGQRYRSEKVIFSMKDPKGDDYGPGKYKYPWGSIFDPKKEHLDLTKFSMLELKDDYCFDLVFQRVTNPWGAPEGFSHPITEIYLSDGSSNGRNEPLRQGSNVTFNPEKPWQYMIKVVSFNRTAVFAANDHEETEGNADDVRTTLLPDKKTIRTSIPRKLLPGDPGRWHYYVVVGSQDGLGPDNFRAVNASPGQWNLGGGTDTDYDPNVIDLLAPPGEQEKVLGSYKVESQIRAVLNPVKATLPVKESSWDEFLDIIINIFYRIE